jgi:hypothetical protein
MQMGQFDGFRRGNGGGDIKVTLEAGGQVLSLDLPSFVRGVESGTRIKMSPGSGDYWHLFKTDETDDRYDDQGGIDMGLVRDDMSPGRWLDIRKGYGKDVEGESPGSFRCPLGEAHFIVRGGLREGIGRLWFSGARMAGVLHLHSKCRRGILREDLVHRKP